MSIPTEFSGTVYIHWHARFEFFHLAPMKSGDEEFILLGQFDAGTIPLNDSRQAAVQALNARIEKERAESHQRIATLQGKIQELLALEVQA